MHLLVAAAVTIQALRPLLQIRRLPCESRGLLALSLIAQEGAGVLIYEQQEGRGIGLMPKLQAYELQDAGLDTVEANEKLGFKADHREFALPAEILKALAVKRVRLLSNNPDKVAALEKAGIEVTERVPCEVTPTSHTEELAKAVAHVRGTVAQPSRLWGQWASRPLNAG